MIPVITTQRLVLRGHQREDFADSFALWSDPEVTRRITATPSTPGDAWQRLLRYSGLWVLLGFGYWVVRESATDRFVGEVGLADFKRDLTPSIDGIPEAGWVLMPWAAGRGYATEAMQAVLSWAEAARDIRHTVCLISPDNRASIKVAGKCGYRLRQMADFKGSLTMLYDRRSDQDSVSSAVL